METDLTVEVAHESDIDLLVHFAVAFRDHLRQSTPSDADFRKSIAILLNDAASEFFLAHRGEGVALGYVQCRYRYSAWTSGFDAELEDVFVVGEARRCGVGRRLVEFAIARATEKGCRSIGLNTNERNEASLALYQRLGFGFERPFWKGGRQLWIEKAIVAIPLEIVGG
jgi:ribosomal protein S18 acetylase RimI-like enzyme